MSCYIKQQKEPTLDGYAVLFGIDLFRKDRQKSLNTHKRTIKRTLAASCISFFVSVYTSSKPIHMGKTSLLSNSTAKCARHLTKGSIKTR